MALLWSPKFFCYLLYCLLPWVHMAEEEKKMSMSSIANLSIPKVPRLFLPTFKVIDHQEVEFDQTEQMNPTVVSLKAEIAANWSQPGLQKVFFQ